MRKIFTSICGALLATAFTANADPITITIQDSKFNDIASSIEASLTKDADGNYVIEDFLWSGSPLKFKFDAPAADDYSDITFEGDLDRSYPESPFLLDSDGEYMECAVENLQGVAEENVYEGWTWIYYPYVCEEGYSYVYAYDMTNPDNVYQYFGSICFNGTLSDGSWAPWLYLNFFFNEPTEGPGEDTGISSVTISGTQVFYDLQGKKVSNPTAGIYVKVVDGKASKVIVK